MDVYCDLASVWQVRFSRQEPGRIHAAMLRASVTSVAVIELEAFQPTMRRLKTSVMKEI
jgi:hypothetical protein